MSHLALYRKYRSQTFGDLVGQEHVVRTIQNGITSGKIAHAYLFTGPRGTGKTSTARLVAKALNCTQAQGAEPCNTCDNCLEITSGNSLDVIELDAASEAGVDDVREKIVAATEYVPSNSKYRVFIIDEVHDLSAKAFDALLKTIEEPPAHVVFILATTEYQKVPQTIRSRCQKYEFNRATLQDLRKRLDYVLQNEQIEAEPAAVLTLARMADGGYRDALSLLEQVILTSEGRVTQEHVFDQLGLVDDETVDALLVGMAQNSPATIIQALDKIYQRGRDPRAVLEAMLTRVSDLTRALYGVDIGADTDSAVEASMRDTAARIGQVNLGRIRDVVAAAHRDVKEITLPRLWLEARLIQAMQAPAAAAAAEARPAPKAAVNRAPEPAPKAEPKAEPKPEPQPVVEEATPEPTPVATVPLEGAAGSWVATVNELSSMSKLMKVKLDRTQAKEEGGKVVVYFEQQLALHWVTEVPKRMDGIREVWKKSPHGELELEFSFAAKEPG